MMLQVGLLMAAFFWLGADESADRGRLVTLSGEQEPEIDRHQYT